MRGAPDLEISLCQHIEGPHQVLTRESLGELRQSGTLGIARNLRVVDAPRINEDHQQVANGTRELPADQTKVVARFNEAAGQFEDRRGILAGNELDDVQDWVAPNQTQDRRTRRLP